MKKTLIMLIILICGIFIGYYVITNNKKVNDLIKYLGIENTTSIKACLKENEEDCLLIPRGKEVSIIKETDENKNNMSVARYENKEYLINKEYLFDSKESVVLEKNIYVRTSATILESDSSLKIVSQAKKNDLLEVIGYDKLNDDGSVNMYKVKYNDKQGYIYAKYVVFSSEEASQKYNCDGACTVHDTRDNKYGGGSAANLDYFPVTKANFENNKMPSEVRSLYLNSSRDVILNVDKYISYAKESNINAIVVDIKDNESPAYKSKVMEVYSKTNYDKAFNTFDEYKLAIKKIKDSGLYVIGRITVFKDKYYVMDHNESAIISTSDNKPALLNGTYWPSPYKRDVWEFNVSLAVEAVKEMGFNEIQFDYVRFPDRVIKLEQEKKIAFRNEYNEEKAQAIQSFLRYATDEIHKVNAYVSADVFGESAHTYVTAYGQYWPAISNVVDVISAMPYPDHFALGEYGFAYPYKVPYDLLKFWGESFVSKRQNEITSKAIVRTWIQAYDALPGDFPYTNKQIEDQIKGLYEAGLNGGFMTWNSGSNLERYKSYKQAFMKEYK